ncbi:MAG: bifunctional diaminohydroxyphosphoribosylaminopyrimidine deaminase/5-amino-6-(5-phosphoribosylamino)uracil reductase RibD [Defluviitaleaceae bacterium]|nr:bifunctional diaminohydroxyphosphoribosylaminopyrimidine deaminase/5-amino-6-(5-phosphoribosylamino)uracil reductase RibD [Defluviitaleaceae bacterium]
MSDIQYMKRALELAKKGMGHVNPNPLVGAVIVKEGEVIGEGYHQVYGGPHAEINALKSLTTSPIGATLYVTLEPCFHEGKTPPCVDAVIKAGFSRVVIASLDPNPLVAGRSLLKMKEAGIEVEVGLLKEACDALNAVFFHYIMHQMPYVVMKYAMTADGKIATHTGASRWITGEEARKKVHEDRHQYTGIMVGVGTVIADDPLLDCRIEGGKNPIRIICDTTLKTPMHSRLIKTAKNIPTVLVTASTEAVKRQPYIEAGCQLMTVPLQSGQLDLKVAMKLLAAKGIDSILLEGGAMLNASALEAGVINKVQTYLAPKLFGGVLAPSPIGGTGVDHPDQAYLLKNRKITTLGEDILIESEVIKCSQAL